MTRRAAFRFVLAGVALVLAIGIWRSRFQPIDQPTAEARAGRLLAAYVQQTGEPPLHFTNRRMMRYADGWEFVWVYRPCRETAELRIFIKLSGAARYSQLPDCSPSRGFAVKPTRV